MHLEGVHDLDPVASIYQSGEPVHHLALVETRLAKFPFLWGLPTNAVAFIQGHGKPRYINWEMLCN